MADASPAAIDHWWAENKRLVARSGVPDNHKRHLANYCASRGKSVSESAKEWLDTVSRVRFDRGDTAPYNSSHGAAAASSSMSWTSNGGENESKRMGYVAPRRMDMGWIEELTVPSGDRKRGSTQSRRRSSVSRDPEQAFNEIWESLRPNGGRIEASASGSVRLLSRLCEAMGLNLRTARFGKEWLKHSVLFCHYEGGMQDIGKESLKRRASLYMTSSTTFSWDRTLQACFEHRQRLFNNWRLSAPVHKEVFEAVQKSTADDNLSSVLPEMRAVIGKTVRRDLGKDKDLLRLCASQLAHTWTMIAEMLTAELSDGLAPAIMTPYLTFSEMLCRIEMEVAEVAAWKFVMIAYLSIDENADLTFVVSSISGGYQTLHKFIMLTRGMMTALKYLKIQVEGNGIESVEEMQDENTPAAVYDYLPPFIRQIQSELFEAIGAHCEVLEGVLEHHRMPQFPFDGKLVRLNATSPHVHARPLNHEELEFWLDADRAIREGETFEGFRAIGAPSLEILRETEPSALEVYLCKRKEGGGKHDPPELRQQASWRMLRESLGDSDYRRRQAGWGKSLDCLAREFETKSMNRSSSAEKLPTLPMGGFSRIPTACSLTVNETLPEQYGTKKGSKNQRRRALPSAQGSVSGVPLEDGQREAHQQSISTMLAESPSNGGSAIQVLAKLQLKASAKTRELCEAKLIDRPKTRKAEGVVKKKILLESKGLNFIFSRNRERVLAAARPFTTSFPSTQASKQSDAEKMSATAPGGWLLGKRDHMKERNNNEKFIMKIDKKDRWQREVLWRRIFSHIDSATSLPVVEASEKGGGDCLEHNTPPPLSSSELPRLSELRHSTESSQSIRRPPTTSSLSSSALTRPASRLEEEEASRAMKLVYYGGHDGDIVEHLDVIRGCRLGLGDGRRSVPARLEIYPMMGVAVDRQLAAISLLNQSHRGIVINEPMKQDKSQLEASVLVKVLGKKKGTTQYESPYARVLSTYRGWEISPDMKQYEKFLTSVCGEFDFKNSFAAVMEPRDGGVTLKLSLCNPRIVKNISLGYSTGICL
ncbi:hypothetical protein FOL47_005932 [Perkinsus chesapeaki]|uniref:Uncharacterized protein n=1 Tax=Perkinsus chesapeaki TaxID=330153 RepID=A0A7J6LV43_PERCH|nr:hypothetical protein FOL47_005932 [Perkinsus chesapeaki]